MVLWRVASRLPRAVVFWALTALQGLVYAGCATALTGDLLEWLGASRGVQGAGEILLLLLGLAIVADDVQEREGWGHKVVPECRLGGCVDHTPMARPAPPPNPPEDRSGGG